MRVEIWLKKDEDDKLLIPVNPPSIGSTLTRNYEDLVIADGNEKTLMGGKNLRDYTITSFLPKRMTYYNNPASPYEDPIKIISKIEGWMNSKTVLLFQVTNTVINKPVTIRTFTWEVTVMGDVDYTLELKQYDPITYKVSNETAPLVVEPARQRPASSHTSSSSKNPVVKSSQSSSKKRIYTVKSGDSLWVIAKKFYGDGSKYTKIYDANKSVIGKNHNNLTLGMKLVIP